MKKPIVTHEQIRKAADKVIAARKSGKPLTRRQPELFTKRVIETLKASGLMKPKK